MKKFKVLILLMIVFKCNGHLRILGDILSTAHDRVHSKVQDVAGTVLGGLSHGVNINFESHVGISANRQPGNGLQHNSNQNGYNPNTKPDTVVVVIKEEENHNNDRPSPDSNYQQPNNPPFNNNVSNKPVNNYNQRPNYNPPNEQGNYNNGQQYQGNNNNNQRPNYNPPNEQGNYNNGQQYQGNNNNYNPNDQHHGSIYGQPDNEHSNINNLNQNNFDRPSSNNPNNYDHNQANTKPVTELITKEPNYKPIDEITTKKTVKDDEPFFVPLNPNEYIYGGDKINNTAPKRDANNNQYENGDYNIDIRVKDD